MDRAELVAFVRRRGLAVVATRGPDGAPRAGEVGVAITDDAEFVFETAVNSLRYDDIAKFAQVALVVGGEEPVTVQSEGIADVLTGDERDRCLRVYLQQFPDSRERALDPDVAHLRIRSAWVRLNDTRPESYGVQEIQLDESG